MTAFYLATCVILDDKQRVLLLHRNRKDHAHWEIPGGKIEEGEDPAKTVVREAQEELDADIEVVRLLGDKMVTEHLAAGTFTNHFRWYLAKVVGKKQPRPAEDGFDGVDYFSVEAIGRGDIVVSASARDFAEEVSQGRIAL